MAPEDEQKSQAAPPTVEEMRRAKAELKESFQLMRTIGGKLSTLEIVAFTQVLMFLDTLIEAYPSAVEALKQERASNARLRDMYVQLETRHSLLLQQRGELGEALIQPSVTEEQPISERPGWSVDASGLLTRDPSRLQSGF